MAKYAVLDATCRSLGSDCLLRNETHVLVWGSEPCAVLRGDLRILCSAWEPSPQQASDPILLLVMVLLFSYTAFLLWRKGEW
jgi:hypothetical protein